MGAGAWNPRTNVRTNDGIAVVTGGLGFVGSHVARELLQRGRRVRILDDGSNAGVFCKDEFLLDSRVELVEGSTLDRDRVRACLSGASELYHFAAMVGVARVAADPAFVLYSNREGASSVVAECERAAAKLLFISSSEVYGSAPRPRAFHESDAPGFCMDRILTDGRAAYAYSKWLGERTALAAAERGLSVVIARPFNIVGAGQSLASGALLPKVVSAALNGETIQLEGDGTQTRAFAWAPEAARAFVELLHCGAAPGTVVNVGGREVRSIHSVAEAARALVGSRSTIQLRESVVPRGVGSIAHRRADLTKLLELLGWVPSAPLLYALRDAVLHARRGRPVDTAAVA